MKNTLSFLSIILAIFFLACSSEQPKLDKAYNAGINITPHPQKMELHKGYFRLNKQTIFVANLDSLVKIANFFSDKLSLSMGYKLEVTEAVSDSNYISLNINPSLALNNEGYTLEVNSKGIKIEGKTAQAVFYGMQTILQLLPAEVESATVINYIDWEIPAVKIEDEPRFPYRGMMLDVGRNFASIDFIKKQLDILAMFKINKFQWHFTEDQGWRIEIKKYSKLTEIGASRLDYLGNKIEPRFYTQEEIKEVVQYAKDRFIEVIPEIELPGHAVSAVAAYPELSCEQLEIPVRNYWGVARDIYCGGNEFSYEFLQDVLAEVIPLFESEYIHIGGDEARKERWELCPKCQARIKELGIKADKEHSAENKLQSYFIGRIEAFLAQHGKKIIGWDEILEGGLPKTATVMSWRGELGGIKAANIGHNVIMSPNKWLYLDRYQGDRKLLMPTIGGYSTLKHVYDYEPVPSELSEEKGKYILGAQGNEWTEYAFDQDKMENDIYPRMIAIAELNWTKADRKDYADFERRIENQRVRLDAYNVNYYIPNPEDKGFPSCNHRAFLDSIKIELSSTEPVNIHYTTNASEPDLSSPIYDSLHPLVFHESAILKLKTAVLSGKRGLTRTITLDKQNGYREAVNRPSDAPKGLKAEYYKGYTTDPKSIEGKTPDDTGIIESPQKAAHRVDGYLEVFADSFYTTVLTGYINIPEDGIYYLSTEAELWIGEDLFITNMHEGDRARRTSRMDRSIALAKGYHPIKILRLGAVFGGIPSNWDSIAISYRKEGETTLERMGESFFN